jgi:TRAP-type mannitol/chloroaromatic compound transport system substrate-binding protein
MERLNVEALVALTERNGVKLRTFPAAMIDAARGHARDITGDIAGRSEIARKIVESYGGFRERAGRWANVSVKAVLDSRGSL